MRSLIVRSRFVRALSESQSSRNETVDETRWQRQRDRPVQQAVAKNRVERSRLRVGQGFPHNIANGFRGQAASVALQSVLHETSECGSVFGFRVPRGVLCLGLIPDRRNHRTWVDDDEVNAE